jgi:hypothetical protein
MSKVAAVAGIGTIIGVAVVFAPRVQAAVLVSDGFNNASRTSNPTGQTPSGTATAVTGLDRGVGSGGGDTNAWNGVNNSYVVATNNNGAMAGTAGGPSFFDAINVASIDNASPTPNSAINGNSLRVMNLGAAYSLSTYFNAVTLANGESLSASFKVKVTKNTPASNGAFRVGLFNSGADRLAANTSSFGPAAFNDDAGYRVNFLNNASTVSVDSNNTKRASGSGVSIFAGSISTIGGSTSTSWGSAWAAETVYDVSMTLARSADGSSMALSGTFGDGVGGAADATFSVTDASGIYTTFDHFAIFFGSQFGNASSASANFIDDVMITYVPEPTACAVLTPVLLGTLRRRRGSR